ncbi:MAG TPA: DUF6401 family natural product biosynthesis protein [Catenuloplanes sp.]|jgi:hypothetical protein
MEHRDGIDRRDSVAWAAQLALGQWARRVGEPGRVALRTHPALVARVDQHAAEVRDALLDADGQIPVVALAAYADGVNDVATARGHSLADLAASVTWSRAPWPLVRMLAVCLLAGAADQVI